MITELVKPSICAVALILGLHPTTSATEVYVTRDSNGNVIFSDQPQDGAATHKVEPLPTVPAFKVPVSETTAKPAIAKDKAISYTSLAILSPTQHYQLPPGSGGKVEVSGVLTPELAAGHTVELLQNGRVVQHGRQTLFSIPHIDRGEHTLQLRVINDNQETLIRSNSVTIYVQRYSKLRRSGN